MDGLSLTHQVCSQGRPHLQLHEEMAEAEGLALERHPLALHGLATELGGSDCWCKENMSKDGRLTEIPWKMDENLENSSKSVGKFLEISWKIDENESLLGSLHQLQCQNDYP